jgi:hypothetical protein
VLLSYPGQIAQNQSTPVKNEGRQKKEVTLEFLNAKLQSIIIGSSSPFLWNQILLAGRAVGWKMSALVIRNWLQKWDPVVFGKISQTTIKEWIDRSGDQPRWSDRALQLAEKGNHQRHPNGERRGALVSDR